MEQKSNRFIEFFKNHKRIIALILVIVLVINITAVAVSTSGTGTAVPSGVSTNASDTKDITPSPDPAIPEAVNAASGQNKEMSEALQPPTAAEQIYQERSDAFYKEYNNGEYDKAIKDITYLIDNYEATATQYCQRALVYSQIGENAKAVSDLLAALNLDPKDLNSLSLISQIYIEQEKYQEALNALTSTIKVIEENDAASEDEKALLPSFYYNRGICAIQTGDVEQAKADFTRVTELPDTSGLSASAKEILDQINKSADGSVQFVIGEQ